MTPQTEPAQRLLDEAPPIFLDDGRLAHANLMNGQCRCGATWPEASGWKGYAFHLDNDVLLMQTQPDWLAQHEQHTEHHYRLADCFRAALRRLRGGPE